MELNQRTLDELKDLYKQAKETEDERQKIADTPAEDIHEVWDRFVVDTMANVALACLNGFAAGVAAALDEDFDEVVEELDSLVDL